VERIQDEATRAEIRRRLCETEPVHQVTFL